MFFFYCADLKCTRSQKKIKNSLKSQTVLFHVCSTREISTCSTVRTFTQHHVTQSPRVQFVLRQAHLDARKGWGLIFLFIFFLFLGKWASLAAVVVSNLGQASYLGWSNENHQYLDVMLKTFFMVFCSQMVFVIAYIHYDYLFLT